MTSESADRNGSRWWPMCFGLQHPRLSVSGTAPAAAALCVTRSQRRWRRAGQEELKRKGEHICSLLRTRRIQKWRGVSAVVSTTLGRCALRRTVGSIRGLRRSCWRSGWPCPSGRGATSGAEKDPSSSARLLPHGCWRRVRRERRRRCVIEGCQQQVWVTASQTNQLVGVGGLWET